MQGALRDHLGKGLEEVGWTARDVGLQCGPDGGLSNTGSLSAGKALQSEVR